MDVFFEIVIALLIAAGLGAAIWAIERALVMPVRHSDSTRISAQLEVLGTAPDLAQTVEGLLWLRKNSVAQMSIVISDGGMDADTRKVAALLAEANPGIVFFKEPGKGEDLEDGWKNR